MNSSQILQAYLNAEYVVAPPAGERLHIGHLAVALASRFPTVAHFALLTAWNPHSIPADPQANLAAQCALDKALNLLAVEFAPALNRARDGRHKEPSRLLLDAGDGRVDALACRFGQAGALAWRASEPVRLRIYRPDWAAPAHADGVDTRFVDWVACPPP